MAPTVHRTHGASIVYASETFDPAAAFKALYTEKCTAVHGVPTHFLGLLNEFERDKAAGNVRDLSSLRYVRVSKPAPVQASWTKSHTLFLVVELGLLPVRSLIGFGARIYSMRPFSGYRISNSNRTDETSPERPKPGRPCYLLRDEYVYLLASPEVFTDPMLLQLKQGLQQFCPYLTVNADP